MDCFVGNKHFSFLYGGRPFEDSKPVVTKSTDGDEQITQYIFPDGLKVTNILKKYPDFDGCEWVNWFEMTGDEPSEIISELWDCDCRLPIGHEELTDGGLPAIETSTRVFAPAGSTQTIRDFYAEPDVVERQRRTNHLYPGKTVNYSTFGGRSSDIHAPFFNVHKNGQGYIFAIGWTGQWNAQITRDSNTITFRSKIEDTNFRLFPGEKFRTSSIVIMPYEGDVVYSQNKWRRFVKRHFSQVGQAGRCDYGPLSVMAWGGIPSKEQIAAVEKIKEYKVPYEYFWMDAGWYGKGAKPNTDQNMECWLWIGDWNASPHIHPNSLKDVSRAVHDAGMKFILWVEIERTIRTMDIAREHPEYFISGDLAFPEEQLLNLGSPWAWQYAFDTLSELIQNLQVDGYRQDFNTYPLGCWRRADEKDRQGITEIKHINGMYTLWDALLERFPNLIIDNCASGGKRLDIETLRRSVPLWRSDCQCPPNFDVIISQCHNQSFHNWMPYSGQGMGMACDEYRIRSAYSSALSTNQNLVEQDYWGSEDCMEFLKKYCEEYLQLRPYYSEDFYPLTAWSDNEDAWCAYQFHRPEQNDGIVHVFKRETSPFKTAVFQLSGVDKSKVYTITDIDTQDEQVYSGEELMEIGFSVTINEKRVAKIFRYNEIRA